MNLRPRACPVLMLVFLAALAPSSQAQFQPTHVFGGAPAAAWIAPPDTPPDSFGVFHFRRAFDLSTQPEQFVVHVSADNRYRLFVNGQQVSAGPQRSDLMHWRYETIDLAPYLRVGRNVLAALVWNWGIHRPVAQFSHRTAFLTQGDTEREALVNTDGTWKVLRNPGYEPIPISSAVAGGYYASPPGEAVDGALYPWGWEQIDFSDGEWPTAVTHESWNAGRTRLRGTHPTGESGEWQLVPRTLPAMEEKPVRFATVRRTDGLQAGDAFLHGSGDLMVPARTRAVLLLDQAHLTNAFAVLETSGGAGSLLTLTYAEALKDANGQKGNRNEIEGKTISGVRDTFRPDGGTRRRFQTLWFRTYRYVQMVIETTDQPLRVHDLHGVFTAYPYEERARFTSDLPWLADMWAMNWRGARLCAWETFFDTPYYEQLQYIGDTRVQALISLYMSGDDRLVRQAILHFDRSRIPEGITNSRYPSDLGQYIPPFSLLYVAMVHDFWMHRDDPAFIRSLLPGLRGVLAWFAPYVDDTGMLKPMPWWSYVDWADAWPGGRPPGADEGHSAMLTLQYAYALLHAADLEEALGLPVEAARYRTLADNLIDATRMQTWDATRGLFRDAPEVPVFSQQTNVMALLVGAVPEAEQGIVMERVLADTTLTRATYYYSYYVFEALHNAGLAERYIEQLAPWQAMLALGLTTTPERPEPTRSDSHAWAAHPNYGLLATVLGVRPGEPGFRSVRITPHLGPLHQAEGRVPHPLGDIAVRLQRTGEEGIRAEVALPPGLSGTFEWKGRTVILHEGTQEIAL